MHGVLGRDGWSPLDLISTGRDEIARYDGTLLAEQAQSGPDDLTGAAITA